MKFIWSKEALGTRHAQYHTLLPINSSLVLFILSTYLSNCVIPTHAVLMESKHCVTYRYNSCHSFLLLLCQPAFITATMSPKNVCRNLPHCPSNNRFYAERGGKCEQLQHTDTAQKRAVHFCLHKRGSTRYIVSRWCLGGGSHSQVILLQRAATTKKSNVT